MISNIIATIIILDPLEQGAYMLAAFAVLWFFHPMLGLLFLAAAVPVFLLSTLSD